MATAIAPEGRGKLPRTSELVERFIESRRAKGLSPRTVETYEWRLARFTAWLGDWPLDLETVERYMLHVQAQGLSPFTVYDRYRCVHALCNWLIERGILASNPARGLKPKVPKIRPANYSVRHVYALLADCSVRDRAIILCLLDTGLRAGEMVSLRRDKLDFESGEFVVVGKGNKERAGWLHPYVLAAIQVYLDTRTDDDPALWYGRDRPLTVNGLYQAMRRRAQEAGIRQDVKRLIHSFRATFSRSYLLQGGSIEELRLLLGHESHLMSLYYAQLSSEAQLADRKQRVNPLAAVLPVGVLP